MLPYYFLVGVPLLFYIFHISSNGRIKEKKIIPLFFAILIVLLCCRDITCGIDLSNYKSYYIETMDLSFFEIFDEKEIEWGYHLFSKICAVFTSDFQIFLCIVAFFSIVPICFFYKKESEIPYLTIVLFLTVAPFSMYFSGLRQVCAMAFAVPAYYCTKKRKVLLFVLTVAVAYCFHQSALVLALIYPVYHMRIKRKSFIWVVPTILGIFLFNEQIFQFLLNFMGERYIERYSAMTRTGSYTVLILLAFFALYSFFLPRDSELEDDVIGLRNLLLFSVVIQCFAPVHSLAMRFNYYYLLFVPVLIPKIAKRSSQANKPIAQISVLLMCCFFSVYFIYYAYTSADILNIYPYVPFWEG